MANKQLNKALGTLLVCSCIFTNFLSFLSIDVGFLVLTFGRQVLFGECVICFFIWVGRLYHKQIGNTLKGRFVEVCVFVFLFLWATASILWMIFGFRSADAKTEVMGIITTCLYAFCFFTLIDSSKDAQFYVKLCMYCGMVLALVANVEVVIGVFLEGTQNYFTVEERIMMRQTLFPSNTVFHNSNDFAAFLLTCLATVAYEFLCADTKRKYIRCGLEALLLLSPLPFINSTIFNIVLCVLIAVVIGFLMLIKTKWSRKVARSTTLLGFTAFYFFPFSEIVKFIGRNLNHLYFKKRFGLNFDINYKEDTLLTQMQAAQGGSGTIYARLSLIRAGVNYFLQSPIIGHGPNSFRELMLSNEYFFLEAKKVRDPHNFYIELLVQYGGMMLLGYLVCVGLMIFQTLKRAAWEVKNGKPGRGIWAFLLIGCFSFAAIMPSGFLRLTPLWMVFVLTASLCSFAKESSEDYEE